MKIIETKIPALFILVTSLLLAGCESSRKITPVAAKPTSGPGETISPEISPNTVQKQEPDPVAQWLMVLEWSFLESLNDVQNPILPDEELIAKFQRHRASFERLRRMIAEDPKLHRVDYDWTDPQDTEEAGVSPERLKEYRAILDEVGCHRGFYADANRIYFLSAAQGTVVASRDQGFYYSEVTPSPLVTNTVAYRPATKMDSCKAFRHIEGHWYICFALN